MESKNRSQRACCDFKFPLHAAYDACVFLSIFYQVIIEWEDKDLGRVKEFLERMEAHLTAAVVSNDPLFLNDILGSTVNGTTYAGMRARTTGAPQNHWFGPAGTPLAAGIGTKEAILTTWTAHRYVASHRMNWRISSCRGLNRAISGRLFLLILQGNCLRSRPYSN